MGLFSNKNKNYLGINIGSSGIKVVELTKKDETPQLVTYGYIEEATNVVRENFSKTQNKISALVKATCDKAKVTTKKAVAALPNFLVFSSIINLPIDAKKNNKELESAINWEAKKFIPIPIEEVVLDWKILEAEKESIASIISPGNKQGKNKTQGAQSRDLGSIASFPPQESLAPARVAPDEPMGEPGFLNNSRDLKSEIFSTLANSIDEGENKSDILQDDEIAPQQKEESLNILLTAAPKNLVKKYIDICRTAGLQLLSLETESFALGRSLIGYNLQPVMIINVGALISDIVIMEKGIPVLSRSIDVGGNTITQSIVNIMNIDARRAEQFKRDFGAPINAGAANFGSSQIGSQQTQISGIPRAISLVLNSLIHEIRYSLELYQNQTNKKVEKVVLTGGSAFLPHFTNYLSETLSLNVYIGNPWDRIAYPTELKPALEDLAPRFAVACGLALREIV